MNGVKNPRNSRFDSTSQSAAHGFVPNLKRFFSACGLSALIVSVATVGCNGTDRAISAGTPDAPANALYVATTGNDSNSGTLEKPFLTIQHCATVARSGFTCIVRAGIYRETVIPSSSGTTDAPITFRPYGGETVLISGADLVTDWTLERGSIYKAPVSWDLGEGNNQVFVDGAMISEAQYPNVPTVNGRADRLAPWQGRFRNPNGSGTRWTITASDVPPNLVGANINFLPGPNWVVETGEITAASDSSLSFDSPKGQMTQAPEFDANLYKPKEGNPYFVWGKIDLLDSPGEWFHDAKTLHVWMPNGVDPSGQTVEVKRRPYAFDLTGRSNIVVQGFQIFASSITTGNPATKNTLGTGYDILLDGINVRYVSHFTAFKPTAWDSSWSAYATTSGLILDGQNITLQNSSVAHSAGNGVWMSDRDITVKNNIIHDVDYSAANGAAVIAQWGSQAGVIADNTLFNAGRTVVNHGGAKGLKILRNQLYNNGLLGEDVGMTGTFQNDGAGTEIAYNLVHDNFSEGISVGIYLDNGSRNFLVHHNLVYNVGTALNLNLPTINNTVYSNTLVGWQQALSSWGPNRNPETLNVSGTSLSKNIFVGKREISASGGDAPLNIQIAADNNLETDQNPNFVNPLEDDYRLSPGSPAAGLGALEGGALKVGANFKESCVYGDDCTTKPERTYGLLGQYYRNEDLKTPAWTRIDPRLNFGWWQSDTVAPQGTYMPSGKNFSARWTGFIEAPVTGTYTFTVTADDGARLWIDNQPITDRWNGGAGVETQGTINLQANTRYPIKLEMHQITGDASVKLEWAFAGQARQVVPRRWFSPK
jgi:hypothetical protein